MFKKIGLTTLVITALFSNPALSTTEHIITSNMSITYELKPNQPEILVNIAWWQINAECTLTVSEIIAPISIMASKKPSSVNGSSLPLDEKVPMGVTDQQVLLISADSGATVELLNLGEEIIKAECRTV